MEPQRANRGFTLMEMLIVIAIIAVLIGIAIPVFTSQLEAARQATDEANTRSGLAVATAQFLTDGATGSATYVYDAGRGTVAASAAGVQPYGQSSNDADYEVGGVAVRGNPAQGGFVSYLFENGTISAITWGNFGHGTLYTRAAANYQAKTTALTSDTASERMYADVDAITAMAEQFLGMTKEEFLAATNTPSAYQGRLTNNEGVSLLTYRNQNGTNPQVRGNTSTLESLGYTGEKGQVASNSFQNSSTRAFFSDYLNSGIEAQVIVGKLEYDSDGKIAKMQAWVRQQGGGTVPDQLQQIVVE